MTAEEEIAKALESIKAATDGATEGCGLTEAIAVLVSQRDNAHLHAETYKKKVKELRENKTESCSKAGE